MTPSPLPSEPAMTRHGFVSTWRVAAAPAPDRTETGDGEPAPAGSSFARIFVVVPPAASATI